MTTYPYEFAIGTELSPQYLFNLDVIAPKQIYTPSSDYVQLGNGDVLGRGFAEIEWYWRYLSPTETDTMRVFCPNGSGLVYIRSLDENLDWHTYRTRMIWPTEPPDVEIDYRMKVSIKFKILEQID